MFLCKPGRPGVQHTARLTAQDYRNEILFYRSFYVMTSQYIKGLSEYLQRGQRSFLDLDNPLYGYEGHNSYKNGDILKYP